jgi:hypothetical protein
VPMFVTRAAVSVAVCDETRPEDELCHVRGGGASLV